MNASPDTNRRIVLARRPVGAPTLLDFRLEYGPVPEPGEGEVLLRTRYLSLDPYMRGRMSDAKSYAPSVALGAVMVGGTVAEVVRSRHPDFQPGELLLANNGWQDYAVSNGKDLMRLPDNLAHPSWALGVLGMPGFTAYMGLLDIGDPQPGETVVVAAATGAVGANVGQIAKLKGCRVVGIAGGAAKCQYAVRDLGFDACLDHREADLAGRLAQACPDGIDVYYENVGGKVFEAVWPLLNRHARVPVCGLIAQYSQMPTADAPSTPDLRPQMLRDILTRSIRIQGFIIFDSYGHRYGEFAQQMGEWVAQGKIKYREHLVDGLENAPQAFIGLLEGKNFGKMVVKADA
ncbi:NADP-dependent oxidoreductase [Pigmentiphaga litoralis]|uniref:NADP-dependent oxidoreductase n=1 Tax=Pigmentiphaga litoralis TaxID=516702 RepID=UPI003B42B7D7